MDNRMNNLWTAINLKEPQYTRAQLGETIGNLRSQRSNIIHSHNYYDTLGARYLAENRHLYKAKKCHFIVYHKYSGHNWRLPFVTISIKPELTPLFEENDPRREAVRFGRIEMIAELIAKTQTAIAAFEAGKFIGIETIPDKIAAEEEALAWVRAALKLINDAMEKIKKIA